MARHRLVSQRRRTRREFFLGLLYAAIGIVVLRAIGLSGIWDADPVERSAHSSAVLADTSADRLVDQAKADDYKYSERDGVAWRWTTTRLRCDPSGCETIRERSCTSSRCWQVDLIAIRSCLNGVYIEANTLDSNGVVVGYTNDWIGSLARGDKARAELPIVGDDVAKARITEINCY